MPAPMPPTKNDKNNKGPTNWGRLSKTLSFWILLLLIPFALFQLSGARADAAPEIPYTAYRQQLERGNITEVTVLAGKHVTGTFREPITVENKPARKFTMQLPAANSQAEVD